MVRPQMQHRVKEEILHIAKTKDLPDEPTAQSRFRMIYAVGRQADLKKDLSTTLAESLEHAKASLRAAGDVNFEPVYDRAFFGQ